MRARWTSDPCYAFFGVDGTECSFLIYLSEVEWFCPPLPWRNQSATRTAPRPLPRVQVGLEGWDVLPMLDILWNSGRDLSPAQAEGGYGLCRRWTDGRSAGQCPSTPGVLLSKACLQRQAGSLQGPSRGARIIAIIAAPY